MKTRLLGAVCACLVTLSLNVNAAIVSLDPTHFFWVDETGYSHIVPQGNHFTGGTSDKDHRSFFAFDLTQVSEPITSATMVWETSYLASAGSTSFTAYDFTSVDVPSVSYSTMRTIAVYNDLGTGVSYGSGVTSSGSSIVSTFSLTLNAAAISALNDSLGSYFSFGLALPNDSAGYLFSGVDPSEQSHHLILNTTAVPVPAAVWLFSSGLIGLIGIAKRKKT